MNLLLRELQLQFDLHKKLLVHKKFIDSDFNVNWLDNEKII